MKVKMWKRIIAGAVAAAVTLSPVTPFGRAVTEEAYGASSWADPYLNNLVNRGILRGDEDGSLRPDDKISRAEFAALVNRTFGFTKKGTKKFSDVKATDWFADDVSIGAYQGFIAGTGPNTASPNAPLTREQAVTMLCRAVKIPEVQSDTLHFTDSKKFENWSKGSIYAASKKGIVSGFQDQSFRPQNNITRAEVAKMLSDMGGEIVNESSQVRFGYVNGNVTLAKSGAGLRDTTVNGDLYITEGVGTGYVILDNVTVLGDVIISGAGGSNVGESSVVAYDCNLKNVIIDLNHDKLTSLISEGDTVIENTLVKSNTFLEERDSEGDAFRNVELNGPKGATLDLSGDFDTVVVKGIENVLGLRKGTVKRMVADEEAESPKIQLDKGTYVDQLYLDTATEVTGQGEIDAIVITANGCVVEQLPNDITIRPGIIANIDGKDMTYDDAERDKATPAIGDLYPQIIDIQSNSATAVLKVNKPGKIYWMVKLPISNAPSQDNLKEPKKDTGVVASGNFTIAADKEVTAKINKLISGEEYVFYAMLEDMREDCSEIKSEVFRTVDNVIPNMITGYPQAEGVYDEEGHKLKYTAVPTKTGDIYWAVLPKGSVAPTVDILINDPLKVPGALDAGKVTCIKNEAATFFATGLKEATQYDTYMAIKDESGNQSKIFKITQSTLDVTAPEFQKNYPKLGSITNNSVNMIFMTDETCTLYWAIYPRGTKVPSSYDEGSAIGPLYSAEAQQEVMTGNNALKAGKTNATVDKEGNFTVSGLQVETPYDLYCVLVDKAGNKSCPVFKKEVNTKDNIQPTAKLEFDPSYTSDDGEPQVGSNIRLVFSEVVYDANAAEKTLLSKVPADRLKEFIQVYDTSNTPRVEITDQIDFSKVVFTEEENKTIATFSTGEKGNADGKAIPLASGNRYVFELKNIADTVGNKMKTNAPGAVTKLDEFRTMAPFIILRNIGSDEANKDIVFEIDPKLQNASPELYFDIIAETDTQMFCDIEKKEEKDGAEIITKYSGIELQPGKFYSMQTLLDGTVYGQYTQFNDLTKTTYTITVTNLDGVSERNLWNKKLTMSFRGISGTKQNLTDAAFAGSSGSFDEIADTLSVSVVSDPVKLDCNKYFSDMDAPEFEPGYPQLSAGDTAVGVTYMTNKPCTVYWLMTPKGSVKTTPDAVQLINGSIHPEGSQKGSMQIPNGKVEFTQYIRELKPNTEYEFYYVIKSNTASPVFKKDVTTEQTIKPEFANDYPVKKGQGAGTATVDTKVIKADGDVYWVVYETGVRNLDGPGTPGNITAEEIGGASLQPDSRIIDRGQLTIKEDEEGTIEIKGLSPERFYDIFMVAKNPLADPVSTSWCTPKMLGGITSADTEAPAVVPDSDATSITYVSNKIPKTFSGSFTVSFTEPLYYLEGLEGKRMAVTKDALQTEFESTLGFGKVEVVSVSKLTADGGITGFTIKFSGVYANATMKFDKVIVDNSGNRSGKPLQLTFKEHIGGKDEPADPYKSYWQVSFGNQK